MEQFRIVLTTASSHDEAKRIAKALVEGRLAACVNLVGGVESIYRWQGESGRSRRGVVDQDKCGKARSIGNSGTSIAFL